MKNQNILKLMAEIRLQKNNEKESLSIKSLLLRYSKNADTTFLHSQDGLKPTQHTKWNQVTYHTSPQTKSNQQFQEAIV